MGKSLDEIGFWFWLQIKSPSTKFIQSNKIKMTTIKPAEIFFQHFSKKPMFLVASFEWMKVQMNDRYVNCQLCRLFMQIKHSIDWFHIIHINSRAPVQWQCNLFCACVRRTQFYIENVFLPRLNFVYSNVFFLWRNIKFKHYWTEPRNRMENVKKTSIWLVAIMKKNSNWTRLTTWFSL